MAEDHELRKKIARCRRSLLIIHDTVSVNLLENMIRAAEDRLAEIEQETKFGEKVADPT